MLSSFEATQSNCDIVLFKNLKSKKIKFSIQLRQKKTGCNNYSSQNLAITV